MDGAAVGRGYRGGGRRSPPTCLPPFLRPSSPPHTPSQVARLALPNSLVLPPRHRLFPLLLDSLTFLDWPPSRRASRRRRRHVSRSVHRRRGHLLFSGKRRTKVVRRCGSCSCHVRLQLRVAHLDPPRLPMLLKVCEVLPNHWSKDNNSTKKTRKVVRTYHCAPRKYHDDVQEKSLVLEGRQFTVLVKAFSCQGAGRHHRLRCSRRGRSRPLAKARGALNRTGQPFHDIRVLERAPSVCDPSQDLCWCEICLQNRNAGLVSCNVPDHVWCLAGKFAAG